MEYKYGTSPIYSGNSIYTHKITNLKDMFKNTKTLKNIDRDIFKSGIKVSPNYVVSFDDSILELLEILRDAAYNNSNSIIINAIKFYSLFPTPEPVAKLNNWCKENDIKYSYAGEGFLFIWEN